VFASAAVVAIANAKQTKPISTTTTGTTTAQTAENVW